MHKSNCWEFKKCGREPGGTNVGELGVCPAAFDLPASGVNGGHHAGRVCWAIAGTFCGGAIQGSFAAKELSCMSCDFFKAVMKEERELFALLVPGQEFKRTS